MVVGSNPTRPTRTVSKERHYGLGRDRLVNADGIGSDFVALATLNSITHTGNLLNELVTDGNLLV